MSEGTGVKLFVLVGAIIFSIFVLLSTEAGTSLQASISDWTGCVIQYAGQEEGECKSDKGFEIPVDWDGPVKEHESIESILSETDNKDYHNISRAFSLMLRYAMNEDAHEVMIITEYDEAGNPIRNHHYNSGQTGSKDTSFTVNDYEEYTRIKEALDETFGEPQFEEDPEYDENGRQLTGNRQYIDSEGKSYNLFYTSPKAEMTDTQKQMFDTYKAQYKEIMVQDPAAFEHAPGDSQAVRETKSIIKWWIQD